MLSVDGEFPFSMSRLWICHRRRRHRKWEFENFQFSTDVHRLIVVRSYKQNQLTFWVYIESPAIDSISGTLRFDIHTKVEIEIQTDRIPEDNGALVHRIILRSVEFKPHAFHVTSNRWIKFVIRFVRQTFDGHVRHTSYFEFIIGTTNGMDYIRQQYQITTARCTVFDCTLHVGRCERIFRIGYIHRNVRLTCLNDRCTTVDLVCHVKMVDRAKRMNGKYFQIRWWVRMHSNHFNHSTEAEIVVNLTLDRITSASTSCQSHATFSHISEFIRVPIVDWIHISQHISSEAPCRMDILLSNILWSFGVREMVELEPNDGSFRSITFEWIAFAPFDVNNFDIWMVNERMNFTFQKAKWTLR